MSGAGALVFLAFLLGFAACGLTAMYVLTPKLSWGAIVMVVLGNVTAMAITAGIAYLLGSSHH